MLRIEIAKRPDGSGVLRCTRADGSVTWQKQHKHGAFFALHDLTHLAVEETLGYRRGFFGLIGEGWEIEDTTGKGSRGPLPAEAAVVEYIVGALDSERAGGVIWTEDELNDYLALHFAAKSPPLRRLTGEELARVRARRNELFSQWSAVAP